MIGIQICVTDFIISSWQLYFFENLGTKLLRDVGDENTVLEVNLCPVILEYEGLENCIDNHFDGENDDFETL